MKGNFMKVAKFLAEEFPELEGHITGGNYPPPPHAQLWMQGLQILQVVFLAFLVLGDNLWNFIPFVSAPPAAYWEAKKFGMQFGIGLFLIAPQIISSMVVTGAFEIAFDGETIFSKMQSGRFPTVDEMVVPLVNAGLSRAQAS
mmetsp:Transcript_4695/g.5646  ORF Transcript_4695/g.5646 Transcript_4695/m.5646 type:complete len:143 (+) Transcript_4695:236-664(+)|eukprot:CAMPEP_0195267794 /NCGR_PEP_ID=MMETSP0706-20130129/12791_1 /TAXON_ID=33640 /ORGANISM="Asterionellopsis glacialis, Strain CCMP134" /LENGTH=142 /DNA_ID=CAMNT_0040322591 /DNA_START=234 /DNA_END=662 /DNA_ORIENTATION=+